MDIHENRRILVEELMSLHPDDRKLMDRLLSLLATDREFTKEYKLRSAQAVMEPEVLTAFMDAWKVVAV